MNAEEVQKVSCGSVQVYMSGLEEHAMKTNLGIKGGGLPLGERFTIEQESARSATRSTFSTNK